jgi:DNA-binding beta-propeller fold protein YncE
MNRPRSQIRRVWAGFTVALTCTAAILSSVSTATAATRPRILETARFTSPGYLSGPTGVALNQETGELFVAESEGDSVSVLEAEGEGRRLSEIPSLHFGSNEPEGVAVDNTCYYKRLSGNPCESADPANGDLYVTESRANAVAKYKPIGGGEYQLVEKLAAEDSPNGVAVDTEGNVYVAGPDESTILEFNSAGSEIGKISQSVVSQPAYVATEAPNTIYLGGYNGGVAKLTIDSAHEVETTEDAYGNEDRAVATDNLGDIFVNYGSYIGAYKSSQAIASGPAEEFGAGLIEGAKGVAVDDQTGFVYVTHANESNVVAFGAPISSAEATTGATSGAERSAGGAEVALNGTVGPANTIVSECGFEWGVENLAEHVASCAQSLPLTGNAPVPVTTTLTGLEGSTTYDYMLVARNEHGSIEGKEMAFQTPAVLPRVGNQPPGISNVSQTSALISASIDTEHSPTTYFIECVEAAAYEPVNLNPYDEGSTTAVVALPAGRGFERVRPIDVSGLRPGASYDCRLVATNEGGTEYGSNYVFATAPATHAKASTGAATGITQTTAVLSGTANAEGLATSYRFEIGPGPEYGTIVAGSIGTEAGERTLAASLGGLSPGTTYHYRLVATNADGTVDGTDRTFTTGSYVSALLSPPSATIPPLTNLKPIRVPKPSSPSLRKYVVHAHKQAKAITRCKKDAGRVKRQRCEREARAKHGLGGSRHLSADGKTAPPAGRTASGAVSRR